MEPWATPVLMIKERFFLPLKLVIWSQFDKYDLNHLIDSSVQPILVNFDISNSWSMVSNAFRRSTKATPVSCLFSMFNDHWLTSFMRIVFVECIGRNPDWFGCNIGGGGVPHSHRKGVRHKYVIGYSVMRVTQLFHASHVFAGCCSQGTEGRAWMV